MKKIKKPKEPLAAAMGTIILSGLGHVYAGRLKRGLIFFLIQMGGLLGLWAYVAQPHIKTTAFVLSIYFIFLIFTVYTIIDAYRCASRFNKENNLERKKSALKTVFLIFGILFFMVFPVVRVTFIFFIQSNFMHAFRITSGAMAPALFPGDRVIADTRIYKSGRPQRGDIAVFRYPKDPDKKFIYRVIAVEGEKVEIKNGDVYVNDSIVSDPRISAVEYFNQGDFGRVNNPVTVPRGEYFLMGDYNQSSHDSRYWGFVPHRFLYGKVYKIYWPPDRSGELE